MDWPNRERQSAFDQALARELQIENGGDKRLSFGNREDSKAQDILMCIQMGRYIIDEVRAVSDGRVLYQKGDEMRALFPQLKARAENTAKIAEKCNVELEFGHIHLPVYDVPEGYTYEGYLEERQRREL